MRNRKNIFQRIDWLTVFLYTALVVVGWTSIYSAVYTEETASLFDVSSRHGKQLVWIFATFIIVPGILLIDERFYPSFGYLLYGVACILLILVLLFGVEVNNSRSWFSIGAFALQPAEFAKIATGLALAKYLSSIENKNIIFRNKIIVGSIIAIPALLILLQPDTGSTLVYFSFIFVLYRFGLPGSYLALILSSVALFIVTVILREKSISFTSEYDMSGTYFLMCILALLSVAVLIIWRKISQLKLVVIPIFVVCVLFILSIDYVMDEVLKPYQTNRIEVLLGLKSDPKGAGYNVNQSLIAIGSGGFSGKGFLKGTQTKFDFVPEQSTDFIFCTTGEELGFMGSLLVIGLFVGLLLRIIFLAERQRSRFSLYYGYCVASILFFHFAINIGMTVGLAPVIGIPLPFMSYGGSSLWAFTILLFVFIKLDSVRLNQL